MLSKFITLFFGSAWNLKCLCQKVQNKIIKKILIFLWQIYQHENNSGISWASRFLGEPCFPHGMKGIFISGASCIGKNCVIFQHVTIGSNTLIDSKGFGAPLIGDCCYIGAGSVIVGNIIVGTNVRIGANAIVYKDAPDNSIVVTRQQRILPKRSKLNNKYYSYRDKWVYYDDGKWITEHNPDILAKLSRKLAANNK